MTSRPILTPAGEPDAFARLARELIRRVPIGEKKPTTLRNERELADWIADNLGVTVPAKRVCQGHVAPLEALTEAYFATAPRSVWRAARGFGGKTVLLAALSVTEAITLGAQVSLLGGSGQQSQRVHEYMRGGDTMRGKFWGWPRAPRELLVGEPTGRETRLTNGGKITALMASARSVRGPHPQRVRADEIDEMHPQIWEAAQGQAMQAGGISEQTVGCSTLHHPDGVMAAELKLATERGWPVRSWCWRETVVEPSGFITLAQVDRKRANVTKRIWEVEYELGEPTVEGRAIDTECVDLAFDPRLGTFAGAEGSLLRFEDPDPKGRYAAGVDLGKRRDKTIIWVNRCDCSPARLVAFGHLVRIPWPDIVDKVERLAKAYPGTWHYDSTGMGTDFGDWLDVRAIGMNMVGKARTDLFLDWIHGLEEGEFRGPMLEYAWREHRFCTMDDLFGTGHPGDTVVAAALAWKGTMRPAFALV